MIHSQFPPRDIPPPLSMAEPVTTADTVVHIWYYSILHLGNLAVYVSPVVPIVALVSVVPSSDEDTQAQQGSTRKQHYIDHAHALSDQQI